MCDVRNTIELARLYLFFFRDKIYVKCWKLRNMVIRLLNEEVDKWITMQCYIPI